MILLTADQIHAWDSFTIQNEPISSYNLMERASSIFTDWFSTIYDTQRPILILCGTGNNGGDGLAIARFLHHLRYDLSVYVCRISKNETTGFAKLFIEQTEFAEKIELVLADAKEYITTITAPIDLVFIDADKKNYLNYYHAVIDKLVSGGLIIADNVLWSGKITMPENEMDKETLALHQFNQFVQQDNRVTNILLPIRDGLMVIRKK